MAEKWIRRLFVGLLFCGLTAGLARTALFPKDINWYENRYAERLPAFSLSGFLDGSYQDGVDAALADQVPFAQQCKRVYNRVVSLGFQAAAQLLDTQRTGRYLRYDGNRLFGDHLTYNTSYLPWAAKSLDEWAERYNRLIQAHPELEFYVYYVEKDTDVNFETGEKAGTREYVFDALKLPEDRKRAFVLNSYPEFASRFYRTDHHWCWEGSYQGYLELLEELGVTEPPVPRGDPAALGAMSGSKAIGSASGFRETFYATPYAYPPMEIILDGVPAEDYGAQAAFFAGEREDVTYGAFYGGDNGEIIFSTGSEGRGNLLVLGESFDNAVLKLLASHFDRLYSVDLRYYSYMMGREFRFSDYVREKEIDRVLLIGNIDFFLSSDFYPED